MRTLGEIVKERVDRVIIENELMRAGFAALPYVVLRDTQLSIGARLTYAVLLSYAWQNDSTFVGQARMAKDMGVSERHLRRFLAELRRQSTLWFQGRISDSPTPTSSRMSRQSSKPRIEFERTGVSSPTGHICPIREDRYVRGNH